MGFSIILNFNNTIVVKVVKCRIFTDVFINFEERRDNFFDSGNQNHNIYCLYLSMAKFKKNKSVGKYTALEKLQKYCAYQDRCHQEVRYKLMDLGIYGEEQGQIIAELITENFLNEERFARSYARGKFRMKGWGKMKIIKELKRRQISAYCLKKGLEEIEDEAYEKKLLEILEKKNKTIKEINIYVRRNKLYTYAYNKGYESFLIQSFVKVLTSNK